MTWNSMVAIVLWAVAFALLLYLMFGGGPREVQYLFMFTLAASMTATARYCLAKHDREMHNLQRVLHDARRDGVVQRIGHHNTC